MEIIRTASAGNVEKNDVCVTVAPSDKGMITVEVNSIVKKQYGEQMEAAAREMAESMGVTSAFITLEDKGALDYVIKARTEAAVIRAARGEEK